MANEQELFVKETVSEKWEGQQQTTATRSMWSQQNQQKKNVFNYCQLFQSGSAIFKRLISRETRQYWSLFDILFIFLITKLILMVCSIWSFSASERICWTISQTPGIQIWSFWEKVSQSSCYCNACPKKYISFAQYTKV